MPHRRLPIGPDAVDWLTTQPVRTVLAVVHNVTALTRLVDVLDAFEADLRVQTVFTVTGSSPFDDGISERLTDLGCIVIPWQQALTHRFDLAISASKGGDIHDLNAPIVIVPHGLGYNKYLQPGEPESRRAGEPESRRAGEPGGLRSLAGVAVA